MKPTSQIESAILSLSNGRSRVAVRLCYVWRGAADELPVCAVVRGRGQVGEGGFQRARWLTTNVAGQDRRERREVDVFFF